MMAMLDSIKGPDGQIKKPILISLVGAGGLLAYLALKGGGSTTSTGQSSALTPDLTGLQTALDNLLANQGSGSGGSGGGVAAPLPGGTVTDGGIIVSPSIPSVSLPTLAVAQPSVPQAPGSSGSAGGGGSGTGSVIQPIAKAPTVYGGLAVAAAPAVRVVSGATMALRNQPTTGVITPFIAALPVGSTIKPGVTTVATPSGGVRMVSTGVSPIAGAMYEGRTVPVAAPRVVSGKTMALRAAAAAPAVRVVSGKTMALRTASAGSSGGGRWTVPTPVYHAPAPLAKPKSNATPTRL
jgi:hypothetical protein